MPKAQAARVFKISLRTIYNKLDENVTSSGTSSENSTNNESPTTPKNRKPGGQPVMSVSEEESVKEHIIALAEFGFPVSKLDLSIVVYTLSPMHAIN